MQTFLDRIDERLQQARDERRGAPIRVANVGGWATGAAASLLLVTVTVDLFAAPLDDPRLVGRIAALNAARDVFALGASP